MPDWHNYLRNKLSTNAHSGQIWQEDALHGRLDYYGRLYVNIGNMPGAEKILGLVHRDACVFPRV
jgi:hypothetical protein